MKVKRISYNEAKPFILNVHYARRMPCIQFAFGLFDDTDELVGVVTYGQPASPSLCKGIAGEENRHKVLELNRLVILPNIQIKKLREFFGFSFFKNATKRLVYCKLCRQCLGAYRICLSGNKLAIHRYDKT